MSARHARFLRIQLERMQKQATKVAKSGGREICGLIVDNGYFLELVQVRNKSKHGGGFSFYAREVRAVHKMARVCDHEIVGTFHSHPLGLANPGSSDLYNAVDDSMMLIFDVIGGRARLWHIKSKRAIRRRFRLI
jgi:proteasome lid subunit RPN8/RPN11